MTNNVSKAKDLKKEAFIGLLVELGVRRLNFQTWHHCIAIGLGLVIFVVVSLKDDEFSEHL